MVRLELLVRCLTHQGSTGVLLLLQIFSNVVRCPELSIAGQLIVSVSPRFLFILGVIMIYLFVHDDKKVQVSKDQENAQSEKDSHSKNRGGKKPN